MARSDLLIKLVEAGSQNDHLMFERTVAALIAEARAKQHHTLANRLSDYLERSSELRAPRPVGGTSLPDKVRDLIMERPARRPLKQLHLTERVRSVVLDVVQEQKQADLLRSHSLEPRNRLLFVGPPGNGKTSLAEAIAYELALPFFVARYEGLVGSYLGETATRLKKVFDFARTTPCVLFLDEFDAIGKERGDIHETGEIKRVVSSLLLQIDDLPSYTVLVAATNHAELLDRAVWRRFQARVQLETPTQVELRDWMRPFADEIGVAVDTISKGLIGASYADAEEFMLSVRRKLVLLQSSRTPRDIVRGEIESWHQRQRASLGGELGDNGPRRSNRPTSSARRGATHKGKSGQESAT